MWGCHVARILALLGLFITGAAYAVDPALAAVGVSSPPYDGSGTVLAAEKAKSLVLTNRHVVANAGVGGAVTVDDGKARYPGQVVAISSGPDLALIVVNGKLVPAELATTPPAPGAEVRTWGRDHTGNGRPVFKRGKALGPSPGFVHGYPVWETSINSVKGDSGCGVFDADDRLCAVNWGGGWVADPSGQAKWWPQQCVTLTDVLNFIKTEAKAYFPALAVAVDDKTGAPSFVACVCTDGCKCTQSCPGSCPTIGRISYAAAEAAVDRGESVTIFVGVPAKPAANKYAVVAVEDLSVRLAPGEYRAYRGASGRLMQLVRGE